MLPMVAAVVYILGVRAVGIHIVVFPIAHVVRVDVRCTSDRVDRCQYPERVGGQVVLQRADELLHVLEQVGS